MAIAGRSYANVPVIVRGSLEDPADFGSKTQVLVVTSQPARAQATVPPVTILRSTLQDPPVLTTPGPVVIAAPADRRWYAAGPALVLTGLRAPVAAAATPGPVVVAAAPDRRWFAPGRALLAVPPPVAGSPPPVTPSPGLGWVAII